MGSRNSLFVCLVGVWLFSPAVVAQDETPKLGAANDEEATHNELRAMREALTKAVVEGDTDAQINHVHENVVVTWQNGQVVRRVDGLKKFLEEMSAGKQRVFQGYKVPPAVDEPTILYGGDTGVAFGSSTPHYKYLGMEFDLENRWTATLVKTDGTWKIAAYHVSANIFDNAVVNMAKRAAYWAGGGCLLIGLVLGCILTVLWKKRGLRKA
ncbi:MAG: YybH family protein [Pirellulaceae bacterium]